ncbi:ribonuclease P (protein C5) [Spiroplasma helicoides]|uniref:Ribonuclease P protein component n=1 Tax=Spiroplasma helicoides TaxID=216938 RepID=A0A1B3SME6_9MOLU|nr:ribonuclease P protein component [Spiroplasma helicoides]AOG61105.1 ribonuclease P (protein C5) [Spiroplasma helicoides]
MKNENIIKKNHHFQKIICKKTFIKSRSFVVYLILNESNQFKYGISVGKKLGNAVIRNKVKRQIRNMIYELLPGLKSKKSHIVIMARNQFLNKDYSYNFNELSELLKTIK